MIDALAGVLHVLRLTVSVRCFLPASGGGDDPATAVPDNDVRTAHPNRRRALPTLFGFGALRAELPGEVSEPALAARGDDVLPEAASLEESPAPYAT